MNTTHTPAILLLALLAPAVLLAQPPDERLHHRARTFLVLRIAEALDLPDAKALQVSRIIGEANEKRRDLRKRRRAVEEQLRDALAQPDPADAEIGKLVAQANEIDEQLALVPAVGMREVQEILTVEQQAKLVLLVPEIQQQVRQGVRRRMKEPGDPTMPRSGPRY